MMKPTWLVSLVNAMFLPFEQQPPGWTQDELDAWEVLTASDVFVGYCSKAFQLLLFTGLLVFFLYKAHSSGQLQMFPIVLSVLNLLNGAFCIARINAVNPLNGD